MTNRSPIWASERDELMILDRLTESRFAPGCWKGTRDGGHNPRYLKRVTKVPLSATLKRGRE
jgi:hypothetical protein